MPKFMKSSFYLLASIVLLAGVVVVVVIGASARQAFLDNMEHHRLESIERHQELKRQCRDKWPTGGERFDECVAGKDRYAKGK